MDYGVLIINLFTIIVTTGGLVWRGYYKLKSNYNIQEAINRKQNLEHEKDRIKEREIEKKYRETQERRNILFQNEVKAKYDVLAHGQIKQNKTIKEIKELADYDETLKNFKPKMKAYYIALINSLKLIDNPELVKFLKTFSMSALEIFQEILKVGFKDFKDWNYEIIENDFNDKKIYLKSTFECNKLSVEKGILEKIINDERNEFMFKLKPIVEKKINDERLKDFRELCMSFIETTVRKINSI